MKKLLLVGALFLSLPMAGLSQSAPTGPRVALFGGYTRVFAQGDPNSASVGTFHFDGGEVSAEVKFTPWVGMVGEYGVQCNLREGQVCQRITLLGPQFSPRAIREFIPFAHVLFGRLHGTIDYQPIGGQSVVSEGGVFAAAVGGPRHQVRPLILGSGHSSRLAAR